MWIEHLAPPGVSTRLSMSPSEHGHATVVLVQVEVAKDVGSRYLSAYHVYHQPAGRQTDTRIRKRVRKKMPLKISHEALAGLGL